MRKTLFAILGLTLLPLPVLAQDMPQQDDRNSSSYDERDMGDRGDGGQGWHGRQDSGHWGDFSHNMYRNMNRGGGGRGAFFMLRNGNATIAVRCDSRESMRDCVDAATMLLDRASRTVPQGGGSGAGPGGSSGMGPGGGSGSGGSGGSAPGGSTR